MVAAENAARPIFDIASLREIVSFLDCLLISFILKIKFAYYYVNPFKKNCKEFRVSQI